MHIPHTPESLLPRSDSKNPAATCRGLTTNGRPCRRSISKSPHLSPTSSPHTCPEAFCWQHREQVTPSGTPSRQRKKPATIQERTSIDTLIDRLGILEVEETKKGQGKQRRKPPPAPIPYDPDIPIQSIEHSPERQVRHRPRPQTPSIWSLIFCTGQADEYKRAPRPTKAHIKQRTSARLPAGSSSKTSSKPPFTEKHRPSIKRDPSSRTGEFLSLIPPSASPQLTAQLLGELAKPFSTSDDEGYIYMFWLTPESLPSDQPSETASTLLSPPSTPRAGQRRTSDVLSTFAPTTATNTAKKTMLLKIGRAQNVHRRLNQWTRQCGYNLSLIRYYPYHPTTVQSNQPPRTPRKVPNAHKIERLIHIELGAQRAQGSGKCEACGKEHREWFEVDATSAGVRAVDEVIRRWADWGERQVAS